MTRMVHNFKSNGTTRQMHRVHVWWALVTSRPLLLAVNGRRVARPRLWVTWNYLIKTKPHA